MEVAAIKAEADQRRTAELDEVRAQMLRLRQASAEQARIAAEEAVAKEVARAKAMAPVARPSPAPLAVREWSDDGFVADQRGARPPIPMHTQDRDRKPWMIAAAVIVVAVVGALAFGVFKGRKSAPETAATPAPAAAAPEVVEEVTVDAKGSGELRVESVPDGARVVLDGREAGFTPLTVKNLAAGRHALILEGESGTLRRTVRVQAGERTVARYEITAGFLSITSRIPLEIYDGNRKIGTSAEGHVLLAPGSYKVRLVNTHYGYREDAEFTIKPGEITTYPVTLPQGSLRVTTEAGAQIFIEGEAVGTAPLAALRVPIGTREVLVRHPQFGERKQSVDIVLGQPVELSVILRDSSTSSEPRTPPRLAPLSMPPDRRPLGSAGK
jgi:PEGA domain-containing protein